jgi:hypothetical protein
METSVPGTGPDGRGAPDAADGDSSAVDVGRDTAGDPLGPDATLMDVPRDVPADDGAGNSPRDGSDVRATTDTTLAADVNGTDVGVTTDSGVVSDALPVADVLDAAG